MEYIYKTFTEESKKKQYKRSEYMMNIVYLVFLHFSTNITCFAILSGYFILGNEKLVILNSWIQEFLHHKI